MNAEEEAALARYFDEHKGDMSLWDTTKPIKIRVRRGGPSAVFSVRFTSEELKLLQSAANARGITISQLIRDAALREVAPAETAGDLRAVAKELHRIADTLAPREGYRAE